MMTNGKREFRWFTGGLVMDRQENWEQNLEELLSEQSSLDLQVGVRSIHGSIRRRKYELAHMIGHTYLEHGRLKKADQQLQQALLIVLTSKFPDEQTLLPR